MKTKTYIPINCGFYDQLEVFAMRQMQIQVVYTQDENRVVLENVVIHDFQTQTDGEYLIGSVDSEPLKIRLDQLIAVNGIQISENYGEACALPARK